MERRVIVELNNKPLVSVPVITYNSSKFVLETLESIKAQTYQNIELIISDDCSTDNTVELCRKWVEENKERFVRTQIITSEQNTGVSANLNRAEAACQGEWVKGIAGDDLLMPDCVESCVKYVIDNPNIYFLFARVIGFNQHGIVKDCLKDFLDDSFFLLSAEKQYERLVIHGNCLPAPTFFYNNIIKRENNLTNDESIPLCEDMPKWINLTKLGFKLYLMDKEIVKYRMHNTSLSNEGTNVLFKKSQAIIYLKYRFKSHLHKEPRQALFCFLSLKRFTLNSSFFSCLLSIYELLEKPYRMITHSKPIDKSYKHYFNPNI